MILDPREKVHIMERRLFAEDLRRHFIGQVIKCEENAIRLRGRSWVFDAVKGEFVRKPEVRERVICLGDRLVINVIPQEVDLEKVVYKVLPQKGLVVTDGQNFTLEIVEFTSVR